MRVTNQWGNGSTHQWGPGCVCAYGDDVSRGNHLRLLEHYQMSWWGNKREKRESEKSVCERMSQRQKENCCYTSQHRPALIETPTQGRVLSSSLWKNTLAGNPAAKTNHLDSVTNVPRSAEAVTRLQVLSVWLKVKNHAVSCLPFHKSTDSENREYPERQLTQKPSNIHHWSIKTIRIYTVLFLWAHTHSHTCIRKLTGWQGGLVCSGGTSPSTLLPQTAVVFLFQPSNRWSKQPFANATKSHSIIMIGHSLFCFGSYFPSGLARENTDCCDCSVSDLLWRSQQEGEKNTDMESQIKNFQLDAGMGCGTVLPFAFFT